MKIGKDTRETMARLSAELASGSRERVRGALLPTGFVLALGGAADAAVAVWRHALHGPLALPADHPDRATLQHVFPVVCGHLGPERSGGEGTGLDPQQLQGYVAALDLRMREAMTRDSWPQYPPPGLQSEEETTARLRAHALSQGVAPATVITADALRTLNQHRRALGLAAKGGDDLPRAVGLFDGVLAQPVEVLGTFVATGARLLAADAAFRMGDAEGGTRRLQEWYAASELPPHELSMVFGLRTLGAAVVAGALAEEVRLNTVDTEQFRAALLAGLHGGSE